MKRNSINVTNRPNRKSSQAENGKEMGRIVTNFVGEDIVRRKHKQHNERT